jgi:hypothetical protein
MKEGMSGEWKTVVIVIGVIAIVALGIVFSNKMSNRGEVMFGGGSDDDGPRQPPSGPPFTQCGDDNSNCRNGNSGGVSCGEDGKLKIMNCVNGGCQLQNYNPDPTMQPSLPPVSCSDEAGCNIAVKVVTICADVPGQGSFLPVGGDNHLVSDKKCVCPSSGAQVATQDSSDSYTCPVGCAGPFPISPGDTNPTNPDGSGGIDLCGDAVSESDAPDCEDDPFNNADNDGCSCVNAGGDPFGGYGDSSNQASGSGCSEQGISEGSLCKSAVMVQNCDANVDNSGNCIDNPEPPGGGPGGPHGFEQPSRDASN